MSGISSNPAHAASAPAAPWKRRPTMTETLTMLGPGRNCDSDNTSRNSSSESQRCCSTSMRRANGMTPPNPDNPILRNPTNSAAALTVADAAVVELSITPMIGDGRASRGAACSAGGRGQAFARPDTRRLPFLPRPPAAHDRAAG